MSVSRWSRPQRCLDDNKFPRRLTAMGALLPYPRKARLSMKLFSILVWLRGILSLATVTCSGASESALAAASEAHVDSIAVLKLLGEIRAKLGEQTELLGLFRDRQRNLG